MKKESSVPLETFDPDMNRPVKPSFRFLQLCVVLCALSCLLHAQTGDQLHFRVKLASELGNTPRSGRLLIFLSSSPDSEKELHPALGLKSHSVWIVAREVENLVPGATVEVYGNESSYPAPFSQVPVGDYQAMALLDVDHHYAYNSDSAGD